MSLILSNEVRNNAAIISDSFQKGDKRISTIFIGVNELIAPLMDEFGKKSLLLKWNIEIDPMYRNFEVIFGRDLRVVRFDGAHLFPKVIDDSYLEFRFLAFLPISCKNIVKHFYRCGYGEGFFPSNEAIKEKVATDLGIPYLKGRSVIEGGNCLLFKNCVNEPRALLGLSSVTLTLISLEKEGYFLQHADRVFAVLETIENPSCDFLRMAKNSRMLDRFLPIYDKMLNYKKTNGSKFKECNDAIYEEFKGVLGLKNQLLEPCTMQQKEIYRNDAKLIEAKWIIAKEIIAEDLDLPIEHIGFISQLDFHIDLSIFPVGNGKIFIHDEEKAIEALEQITPRGKREKTLVDAYKAKAQDNLTINTSWKQEIIQEIDRLCCFAVSLPGKFEGEGVSPVNLMNALVVAEDDVQIVTAQSGFWQIDDLFADIVKRNIPEVDISFLDFTLMSTLLKETSAGLHCVSWEKAGI